MNIYGQTIDRKVTRRLQLTTSVRWTCSWTRSALSCNITIWELVTSPLLPTFIWRSSPVVTERSKAIHHAVVYHVTGCSCSRTRGERKEERNRKMDKELRWAGHDLLTCLSVIAVACPVLQCCGGLVQIMIDWNEEEVFFLLVFL